MTADHLELAFDLSIYDPAQPLTLGGLALRFQPVPHYIPANAVEFSDGEGRFTFGADCGPSEDLCAFAAGTDLLMVEATLPEPEPPDDRGHLTRVRGGRARGQGGREAPGPHALRRRARRRLDRRRGGESLRRARSARPTKVRSSPWVSKESRPSGRSLGL